MKSLKKLFRSKSKEDKTVEKDAALKQVWAEPALAPGNFGQFPPTFSVFFNERTSDKKSDLFYLGDEHRGGVSSPLYGITTFKKVAHLQVILHSGPGHDSPALALTGNERHFRSGSIMGLPAPASGPKAGSNQIARIVDKGSIKRECFQYTVVTALDPSAEQPTETFEWRREDVLKSGADETFERKLVRLSTTTPEREDLVGKWIGEPMKRRSDKLGQFTFLGAGATGEFGQYWTLATVVSLLRILQSEWVADIATDKMIEATGKIVSKSIGLVV